MDDLIAFLRARLDELEEYAEFPTRLVMGQGQELATVGQHDSARVLAEVDAKRQIIELAEEATGIDQQVDGDRLIGSRDKATEPYVGDRILRQLAVPYDDHPSFREEWRP